MANVFGYTTRQLRTDPAVHIDMIRKRRDEFGLEGLSAALEAQTISRAVGSEVSFPEMGIAMPCMGPITNAACTRPIELMLRDTIKHPQKLHDFLSWCVDYTLEFAQMFHEKFHGGVAAIRDPVGCFDILGMKNYKRFSEPHLTDLIAGLPGGGRHAQGNDRRRHPLLQRMHHQGGGE